MLGVFMKQSEQSKLLAVQAYLNGAAGFKKVALQFGISAAMLRAWVARYRLHGLDGLAKRSWGRYSSEFKLDVVRHMRDNGLSYRQTAAVFNLPNAHRVAEWDRRFENGGAKALAQKASNRINKLKPAPIKPLPTSPEDDALSREELLKELAYLRAETAYLKKLKALVESDKSAPAKKRK